MSFMYLYGDFINVIFSFCNCNHDSLATDNFHRAQLLAHNSVFNYGLISLCETNDSVELPNNLIENYTFYPATAHIMLDMEV